MSVKILDRRNHFRPFARYCGSRVCGRSCRANDKGRLRKGEGHEVGCHSQGVREEVSSKISSAPTLSELRRAECGRSNEAALLRFYRRKAAAWSSWKVGRMRGYFSWNVGM